MPHQPTSNRLALAIAGVQARVEALDAAKREDLDASMAIESFEHEETACLDISTTSHLEDSQKAARSGSTLVGQ